MQKVNFFVLSLMLCLLMSGLSFGQTPQPIQIQFQIPSLDWGAIVSRVLSSFHPAVIAAIGLGLSVFVFTKGYELFKSLSMGNTTKPTEEGRFNVRYESNQRWKAYKAGRESQENLRSFFNNVNAAREHEENERRREEQAERDDYNERVNRDF